MAENGSKTWTYKASEIFDDIPNDPKNCTMKIPQEIADEIGLVPGDTVKVLLGDQGTVIIQKADKKDIDGKE